MFTATILNFILLKWLCYNWEMERILHRCLEITLVLIIGLTIETKGDFNNVSADRLCQVCECVIKDKLFQLNCTEKSLTQFPDSWPREFTSHEDAEEKAIVAVFKGNNFTKLKIIPRIISKHATISLRGSNIEEIEYAAFKDVDNIYYLDLGFNKLTGDAVRGDIFRGEYNIRVYEPINLKILNLESNRIVSLHHRMFQHTPDLKELYLKNNPINVIDSVTLMAISSTYSLQVLDISYIGVSLLPDDMFRKHKQLNVLDLSGNKLVQVPEALGSVGASLQYLNISHNLIPEIDDNSFLGLWRLKTLEIQNLDTLTTIKAGAFSQLRSLKALHISNNRHLYSIDQNAFGLLKSNWPIKELYLNGNNLQSLPTDLVIWKDLATIDLQDNPWNCDCNLTTGIIYNIVSKLPPDSDALCVTPLELSGELLKNLLVKLTCTPEKVNDKPNGKISGPFRRNRMVMSIARPRSILVGLAFIGTIILIGVGIGIGVSHLRNKFKTVMSVPSVRYTNINLNRDV